MKFWKPKLSAIMGRLPEDSSGVNRKSLIGQPRELPTSQTTDASTTDSVTQEGWVLVNGAQDAHVPVAEDTGRRPMSSTRASPEPLREGTGSASKNEKFWTVDDIYDLHRISKRNVAGLRRAARDARRETLDKVSLLEMCHGMVLTYARQLQKLK